ncbi:hypothetical protein SNN83_003803 [Cronobacter malonaticus]|nr:hypothetical protein [Cronobacter malonaticus]
MKKWKFLYWLNHIAVITNALLYLYNTLGVCDALNFIVATILSIAPVFISCLYWPVIFRVDVSSQYFNNLFTRKVSRSLPLILLIQAWSWWGGGVAILGGSIIASWLGNAVFWFVGAKDLNCVLPEVSNRGQVNRRVKINSGVSRKINPATGLPMVGAVDVKGNYYGVPARASGVYPEKNTSDHYSDYYRRSNV